MDLQLQIECEAFTCPQAFDLVTLGKMNQNWITGVQPFTPNLSDTQLSGRATETDGWSEQVHVWRTLIWNA